MHVAGRKTDDKRSDIHENNNTLIKIDYKVLG